MPLTPISGTLGKARATHLLRRVTCGATKKQIDDFATLDVSVAITKLFDTDLPAPILPLDDATGLDFINNLNPDSEKSYIDYFKSWLIGQLMANGIEDDKKVAFAFREKLVFFMHTFFTTMAERVRDVKALYYQTALFRLYCFDTVDRVVDIVDEVTKLPVATTIPTNFRELTKKISVDNAMLIFLDGYLNVKGSPNENYARELLELYSIGRGLEKDDNASPTNADGEYQNYTEQDVRAAANVLTGFIDDDSFSNIDVETGLPRGIIKGGGDTTTSHETDSTKKVFSSLFGNTTIDQDQTLLLNGNPTEESMLDELSQLVDLIYTKDETARHVCRRLYRFFVYHEITSDIDDDIIASMTATFKANNFKIQPVLEELFQSKEFYEAAVGVEDDKIGAIIKSPLEVVINAIQFLEIQVPDYETETTDFYDVTAELLKQMEMQGLNFYEPFEVAGYTAYHQYPAYNRNWISPNYLANRYNYINGLISNSFMPLEFNSLEFVEANYATQGGDAKALIIELVSYLFSRAENLDFDADAGDVTKERLRYFLQVFLAFTDYTDDATKAVDEWKDLYADKAANSFELQAKLDTLFNAILQTPENQLM